MHSASCVAARGWLVLALLIAVLVAPSQATGTHAISGTGHYSHRQGDCASRSDPVTVVFTGTATTSNVNTNLVQHTILDFGASPNAQYYATNGNCLQQTVDRSTCAVIACTRYHIRARLAAVTNPTYGTTTQATPHHEDWVTAGGCGFGNHAVDKGGVSTGLASGFDQGRTLIFNSFSGASGHTSISSFYWGNTQEFIQCDGDPAGSNGWVFYIPIPHGH